MAIDPVKAARQNTLSAFASLGVQITETQKNNSPDQELNRHNAERRFFKACEKTDNMNEFLACLADKNSDKGGIDGYDDKTGLIKILQAMSQNSANETAQKIDMLLKHDDLRKGRVINYVQHRCAERNGNIVSAANIFKDKKRTIKNPAAISAIEILLNDAATGKGVTKEEKKETKKERKSRKRNDFFIKHKVVIALACGVIAYGALEPQYDAYKNANLAASRYQINVDSPSAHINPLTQAGIKVTGYVEPSSLPSITYSDNRPNKGLTDNYTHYWQEQTFNSAVKLYSQYPVFAEYAHVWKATSSHVNFVEGTPEKMMFPNGEVFKVPASADRAEIYCYAAEAMVEKSMAAKMTAEERVLFTEHPATFIKVGQTYNAYKTAMGVLGTLIVAQERNDYGMWRDFTKRALFNDTTSTVNDRVNVIYAVEKARNTFGPLTQKNFNNYLEVAFAGYFEDNNPRLINAEFPLKGLINKRGFQAACTSFQREAMKHCTGKSESEFKANMGKNYVSFEDAMKHMNPDVAEVVSTVGKDKVLLAVSLIEDPYMAPDSKELEHGNSSRSPTLEFSPEARAASIAYIEAMQYFNHTAGDYKRSPTIKDADGKIVKRPGSFVLMKPVTVESMRKNYTNIPKAQYTEISKNVGQHLGNIINGNTPFIFTSSGERQKIGEMISNELIKNIKAKEQQQNAAAEAAKAATTGR